MAMMAVTAVAQTEVVGKGLSSEMNASLSASSLPVDLLGDSLKLTPPVLPPTLTAADMMGMNTAKGFSEQSAHGAAALKLWKNAYLGFEGSTYHLPGLMNTETGIVALHQDWGRWHFTAMAVANKYWMPWQRTLSTQYGIGGTVGYDLSEAVTLHAFGYYYATQMQVGPAFSPYMNTTSFGGFADVRFSKTLGTHVGVQRYMNPMNGKWTTEPIVSPYIKLGNSKIVLPLGSILKKMVWGDRDNPLRYRPHPMSLPPARR